MQDFRKLQVWERARVFAVSVRRAVEGFPRVGYADLKSQLISAAESIGHNIVEGCGAASRKEFARYLDISLKSASEADHQLELAYDYGVLPYRLWKPLADEIIEIRRMLAGLRRAVLAADRLEKRRNARKRRKITGRDRGAPSKRAHNRQDEGQDRKRVD